MEKSVKNEYEDIKINSVYEFERIICKKDLDKFAELSGNYNPLHTDESYALKSKFGRIIAHGMLTASFFSKIFGMYCPGEKALCLSQSLNFVKPVFIGDKLKIRATVIDKKDSIKVIIMKTEIFKEDKICVKGEAKVIFIN